MADVSLLAMKTAFFNHPRVRQFLTLVFLSGALVCIFVPDAPMFAWWARQNVGVAFGYVLLGISFLFSNNFRLMFVCLGCGAVISFHYHEKLMRSLHRQELQPRPKQWEIPYVVPVPGELSNYVLPHAPAPPY